MDFAFIEGTEEVPGFAFQSHFMFHLILCVGQVTVAGMPADISMQNRLWPGMSRHQTTLPPGSPAKEAESGMGAGAVSDKKCLSSECW